MHYYRFIFLVFIFSSCRFGEKVDSYLKSPQEGRATSSRKVNVLVEDTGFLFHHEVFKDKIIGFYTHDCKKEKGCVYRNHLKTPLFVKDKNPNQEALEKAREVILSKNNRPIMLPRKLKKSFKKSFNRFQKALSYYHGTATAGLIALHNPHVNLVFVESSELSGSLALTDSLISQVSSLIRCPSQEKINEGLKELKDPSFQKKYIFGPLSKEESSYLDILKKHDIRFVNNSFGELNYRDFSKKVKKKCSKIDLSEFYILSSHLEGERKKYLDKLYRSLGLNVTVFQSAGNNGREANNRKESKVCYDKTRDHFIVGSFNYKGERSKFSNHGDCVTFDYLGEDVIVPTLHNSYFVASGTSFSTPLAIREITRWRYLPSSHQELQLMVERRIDKKKNFALSTAPLSLAFEAKNILFWDEGTNLALHSEECSLNNIPLRKESILEQSKIKMTSPFRIPRAVLKLFL